MNKWFHIPLWRTNMYDDEWERLYIRIEFYLGTMWGSGGRTKQGKWKIYRRAKRFELAVGWSLGKVTYSTLVDEY